jgi:hypothetical protein
MAKVCESSVLEMWRICSYSYLVVVGSYSQLQHTASSMCFPLFFFGQHILVWGERTPNNDLRYNKTLNTDYAKTTPETLWLCYYRIFPHFNHFSPLNTCI